MDTREDELRAEITKLRELLHTKEEELARLRREKQVVQEYGLSNDEICRYSRQLFLPEVGVQGMQHMQLYMYVKKNCIIEFLLVKYN